MRIEQSPEIWHRDDFPLLCQWRRLVRCVEIGVAAGEYSQTFLRRHWNLSLYLGVDNYAPYEDMPWERSGDLASAQIRFERHAHAAKLINASSIDVANQIKSNDNLHWCRPYHFIYHDAAHNFKSVMQDLEAWWDLLAPEGIYAGHDFDGDHPEVKAAVTAFAQKMGIDVIYFTPDVPNSWYFYKNGMPGPGWRRVQEGER